MIKFGTVSACPLCNVIHCDMQNMAIVIQSCMINCFYLAFSCLFLRFCGAFNVVIVKII